MQKVTETMHMMSDEPGHHNMMTTGMMNGAHGGHHAMTTHNHNLHHMGMATEDHMSHDPGSSDHSSGGHNGYFTIGEKVILLFQNFSVIEDDIGSFIAACVVIFVIAALYEGLKVFREILIHRYSKQRGYEATDLEKSGSMTPLAQLDDEYGSTMWSAWNLLQSLLHIVQVTVSYMLMLLVMTFDVWIGLSVVLGAGFGHFLFAWKRKTTTDVNEHCN
ncbi:high affinity copper uptake protein 1-like [Antedon mediterranea]|uniref:high affinity copper uptake protein 1-like n=1 Tax=Antedon mediterranea TaxID=105859 RepID=UPI003AF9E771